MYLYEALELLVSQEPLHSYMLRKSLNLNDGEWAVCFVALSFPKAREQIGSLKNADFQISKIIKSLGYVEYAWIAAGIFWEIW